jgi:hypothetical protein
MMALRSVLARVTGVTRFYFVAITAYRDNHNSNGRSAKPVRPLAIGGS